MGNFAVKKLLGGSCITKNVWRTFPSIYDSVKIQIYSSEYSRKIPTSPKDVKFPHCRFKFAMYKHRSWMWIVQGYRSEPISDTFSFIHSFIHSFTHTLIHSFIHAYVIFWNFWRKKCKCKPSYCKIGWTCQPLS